MAKAQNILLICADQWRADAMSAVGHPNVSTPNLDALARDGVLFENHFGQCPPCGPSRTSLLTGLYLMNHRSGCNGTPLDRRHTNLALEMRKASYDPVLFGYTDTTPDPREMHPNDPALTAYDEGVMPGFRTPMHLPEDMGPWVSDLISKGYDIPNGRDDVFRPDPSVACPTDRGFRFRPTVYPAEHSETAFVTDHFLKWLSLQREKPWCAHLVFFRPHPPLIAPQPYNALVDPADVDFPNRAPTPEQEAEQHPLLALEISKLRKPGRYDEHNPADLVAANDLDIRQMRAAYFGLIAEVDLHVGRIIDQLKSSGQYDNTLIIFTSDHGEMLGDHYVWGKEIYFDQSFHLPLIIRDPSPAADGVRGQRITELSEAIDIMPTILNFLDQPIPRNCDGASLIPLLRAASGPSNWRREVFFEHDFRNVRTQHAETVLGIASDQCSYAVIRDKAYKYIHFAALPPLLFDIVADPGETHNLATDPAMMPTLLHYAQRMLN